MLSNLIHPQDPPSIIKRTGAVLIIASLIVMAGAAYATLHGRSYGSILYLGLPLGAFLMRGSLRTAAIEARLSIFFAVSIPAISIFAVFEQPLDLTLTQISLAPGHFAFAAVQGLIEIAVFIWVARELTRPVVKAALLEAGKNLPDFRIPAAIGLALPIVFFAALTAMRSGPTEAHAIDLAKQQVGDGFKFHVNGVTIQAGANGSPKKYICEVSAWNRTEVESVKVQWQG